MKITKGDLQRAAQESILTTEQSDRLWDFLDRATSPRSRFDVPHVDQAPGGHPGARDRPGT